MALAHPDIDWAGGDNPQSPADPIADAATIQPYPVLWNRDSLAFPSSTSVAPDPGVGYATTG